MADEVLVERAAATGPAAEASLEELLTFERLLFDLSARFANVAGEQVVPEIESALKQLLKFLGFDRSSFAEFNEGKQDILCSVQVKGVEPHLRGPIPAYLSWFGTLLRSGHTIVIRSYEDFPPEAAAALNTIAASVFASSLSFPFQSAAASLRLSGLAHSAPRANGQTSASRG